VLRFGNGKDWGLARHFRFVVAPKWRAFNCGFALWWRRGQLMASAARPWLWLVRRENEEERDGSFGLWGSREVVTVEEKQALVNAPPDQLRCRIINTIYYYLSHALVWQKERHEGNLFEESNTRQWETPFSFAIKIASSWGLTGFKPDKSGI